MTSFPLILPQISINGTNKRELVDQLLAVEGALRNVMTMMSQASPHGRDFQHKPELHAAALAAWVERQTMIANLHREIGKHAAKIYEL